MSRPQTNRSHSQLYAKPENFPSWVRAGSLVKWAHGTRIQKNLSLKSLFCPVLVGVTWGKVHNLSKFQFPKWRQYLILPSAEARIQWANPIKGLTHRRCSIRLLPCILSWAFNEFQIFVRLHFGPESILFNLLKDDPYSSVRIQLKGHSSYWMRLERLTHGNLSSQP